MTLQHAGWQQAELIGIATEFDGVPGVVTALIPNDDVMLFRQKINDLAFGFVAPLQSNDRCCRHDNDSLPPQNTNSKDREGWIGTGAGDTALAQK